MPLPQVSGYHALIRRSARTEPGLAAVRADLPAIYLFEDGDLALMRLGDSSENVEHWIEKFKEVGMQQGEDFVVSNGQREFIELAPAWLNVELASTGNPPELEAQMEPHVRAFWESSRKLWYSVGSNK